MKLAIAGDSAGEGLAKVLADHLKDRFEVSEISRTDEGPDAFYANLSDRVASQVMDGTYDRAILVCGTGIGVCIAANKVPGIRAALTAATIASGSSSTRTFAPTRTVSTHSVEGRIVTQGTPYQYASFCSPPESVRMTRACEASAASSR